MAAPERPIDRLLAAWHQRGAALKAVSFGMIGVINTAIDASVFFVALATLTSSLVAANVLAWLVAVSCSYVMNSFITFARESGRKLRWRDYGTFAASGIAGVIVNTATLVAVAQVAPVWVAKAARSWSASSSTSRCRTSWCFAHASACRRTRRSTSLGRALINFVMSAMAPISAEKRMFRIRRQVPVGDVIQSPRRRAAAETAAHQCRVLLRSLG